MSAIRSPVSASPVNVLTAGPALAVRQVRLPAVRLFFTFIRCVYFLSNALADYLLSCLLLAVWATGRRRRG